jgi:replicative DNA helicase
MEAHTGDISMSMNSKDAERGLISSCVKDYENWPHAYGVACGIVNGSHFETREAIAIWKVLGDYETCPDEIILMADTGLEHHEVYLFTDATESSVQVESFADLVLKCWTARQAKIIAQTILDGLNGGEDAKQVLSNATASASATLSEQGSSYLALRDVSGPALQHCFDMDDGKIEYLKTGFHKLDCILGGLKPGEMSILSARPSIGKTAFAMSIAAQICSNGGKLLFSSLEMSREQLMSRLIHGQARVPIINSAHHYVSGDRQKLREAAKDIEGWNMKIDDTCGITASTITAKAISEKHKWDGLDLVIIDYLGIMGGEGKDIYERISGISRGLQAMAKKLKCPVLVLSQQNREAEKDNTPSMRHLRDSGSIEQDADQIIMLKRVEEGAFNATETVDAWVVKNRNGSTGKTPLVFCRPFARYEDYANQPKP